MPPASETFRAKVARAVKAAMGPSVARKTAGRSPVWERWASDRSRRRSNGSAARVEGRGAIATWEAPGAVARDRSVAPFEAASTRDEKDATGPSRPGEGATDVPGSPRPGARPSDAGA